MMAEGEKHYTRTIETYRVPEITLINHEGSRVALRSLLESPQPVALNFIFTTCTTVCPVMTASFSQMRRALGSEADGLHSVSISIDPEHDTPTVLKTYAEKFGAGSDWQFLTGSVAEITQVQRAFDAYTGSKVNHRPLTFLKSPGAKTWVRIDGLAGATDLASEYRQLLGK